MNPHLKLAYEAGVARALEESGILKSSAPNVTPSGQKKQLSPEHFKDPPSLPPPAPPITLPVYFKREKGSKGKRVSILGVQGTFPGL